MHMLRAVIYGGSIVVISVAKQPARHLHFLLSPAVAGPRDSRHPNQSRVDSGVIPGICVVQLPGTVR
jgi:hypothetical protein